MSGEQQKTRTTHAVKGEIGGNEVTIMVEGPEAQVLDEGSDRTGSDVVTTKIQRALDKVAKEVDTQ